MKRNKKRSRRRSRDRGFDAIFRDERSPSNEGEDHPFDEDRIRLDHDWWREDLAARASRRERLRQRDLRKGLLDDGQVRRRSFDAWVEPTRLDEEGRQAHDDWR